MLKLHSRLGWLVVCVTLTLPASAAIAESHIAAIDSHDLTPTTQSPDLLAPATPHVMTYQERLIQSQTRTAARMSASNPRKPIRVGGPEHLIEASASSAASYSQNDFNCLAEALYFEARGEGSKGQAAVAEVILNRVDSPAFPRSVCGVVNQRGQFSYKGAGMQRIRDKGAFARVSQVARAALSGAPRVLTGGATHFHTPAVRPAWSRRFTRTARIGRHIFYRRGGASQVASN